MDATELASAPEAPPIGALAHSLLLLHRGGETGAVSDLLEQETPFNRNLCALIADFASSRWTPDDVDHSAIVLQLGSHLTRAGTAGDDSPCVVFSSVIGTPRVPLMKQGNSVYVGDEACDEVERFRWRLIVRWICDCQRELDADDFRHVRARFHS